MCAHEYEHTRTTTTYRLYKGLRHSVEKSVVVELPWRSSQSRKCVTLITVYKRTNTQSIMAKVLLYVFVALLSVTLITAATTTARCGRHGDNCVADGDCCGTTKCHRFAHRCQVQITADELMAQREKILGRKGKDYK